MIGRKIFYFLLVISIALIPESAEAQKTEEFRTNGQVFKSKSKPKPPRDDEDRCPRDEFRTIDGACNNLRRNNELWGASDVALKRSMLPEYGSDDHFNSMAGENRPSPRAISNALCSEPTTIPSERGLSSFVFTWGQFLDHDISLTPEDHLEYEPIELPSDEPLFSSDIPFFRSAIYEDSGVSDYRQQRNLITSYIDASNVYGSDEERAEWLRSFVDGKLKTSVGDMLPYNTLTGEYNSDIDPGAPSMAGDGGGTLKTYVAGDVRAAEQPGLTSLHTLFVREHNRICDRLIADGMKGDEEIYQTARKEIGAIIQNITYYEFLPSLGVNLKSHRSYDDRDQADITNLFATAAYRLGHTMVTEEIILLEDDCSDVNGGSISLLEGFFNPAVVQELGLDPILKGLSVQTQNQVDLKITDNLRNFLFGDPNSGQSFGLDLASLNIQRGRDHGLPDYNSVRKVYTGKEARNWRDITRDNEVQKLLEELYGDIDDIDLWVGLLAEDKKDGSSVGKTLHAILKKQFEDLRDGDRYYFEHDDHLRRQDRNRIRSIRLSDVIKNNTGLSSIQLNVFFAESCAENKNLEARASQQLTNSVRLYPNPSSESINLILAQEQPATHAEIYDLKGSLIRKILIGSSQKAIDISQLEEGTYILKVYGEELTESIRFVKI